MGGWVGGGGWCYCCTAVLLLHCFAVTLARRRPLAQSIAPSIVPSITRRHRRPRGRRSAAVVDRLSSPDRSLARSPAVARPASLAQCRSPTAALVNSAVINYHVVLESYEMIVRSVDRSRIYFVSSRSSDPIGACIKRRLLALMF